MYTTSRFQVLDERMHNVTAPRGAKTPWQISRFVSGRGVSAASRSKNSSGSNTSSRVPSCQARFSSSATRPSARTRRRSCAKGGRSTYRHSRSSPARSFAPTHTLACRSKPSRCACRGPRDITPSASASSPRRRTRRPARPPSATRPCTDALTIPASSGDSSPSGSAGPVASSSGARPRRCSSRPTRARISARISATSSSLGPGAG